MVGKKLREKSNGGELMIAEEVWKREVPRKELQPARRIEQAENYSGLKFSLYFRYYHGGCSDELKSEIPPKACFARGTRFADSQHSSAVKLEKCRTTSFANTFVPMTSRNWNSLPVSIFPSTYNLQTFKTRVHKNLRLRPLT